MAKNIKSGTVEGTGAAINVSLGFLPNYVKVFNYDDAGSLFSTIEWWSGMASGHGLKTKSITDSGSTGNKSSEKITSGGISQYAGSTSAAVGFTIGTDADINANGETLFYLAIGNSDGN